MEKKRDRQPNWTIKEELAYVASYAEHIDVLEGEFSGGGLGGAGVSNSTKEGAWREVMREVNSVSVYPRKIEYIKKKWAQLKCSALKKNRENLHVTGGGRGAILTEAEILVLEILRGKNSSTITGVAAGAEIFSIDGQASQFIECPVLPEDFQDQDSTGSYNVQEYPLEGQVIIRELIERNADYPAEKQVEESSVPADKPSSSRPTARTPSIAKKRKIKETLGDEWMREEISLIQLKKQKLELEIKILRLRLKHAEE